MATDKWVARLEAKLDALLEKAGIKPEEVKAAEAAPAAPRELTALEQQAIDNAPRTPVASDIPADRPRVTAQNAPDTSSSVPSDAVGTVTVETREPDGDMTVETMPASQAKGRK